MRTIFVAMVVMLLVTAASAESVCAPSESLSRAVVGIERRFEPHEVVREFNTLHGIRGTAWFLNSTTIVTAAHVIEASKLTKEWKEVKLFWSDARDKPESNSVLTHVRIKDSMIIDPRVEPLITLELEQSVAGAATLKIRATPLRRSEKVFAMGYKDQTLRFGEGRLAFPEPSDNPPDDGQPPLPYIPFELVDTEKKRESETGMCLITGHLARLSLTAVAKLPHWSRSLYQRI